MLPNELPAGLSSQQLFARDVDPTPSLKGSGGYSSTSLLCGQTAASLEPTAAIHEGC